MSYVPNYIASYENDSGLQNYFEPFLIPEKAYSNLEDCYCYRGRVQKRNGVKLLGRLRRAATDPATGSTAITLANQAVGTSYTVADLLDDTPDVRNPGGVEIPEPFAEIVAGTLIVTVGTHKFTDNGDGTLIPGTVGDSGTINYITGSLSLTFGVAILATNVVVTFDYYPSLPVMGLRLRELPLQIDNDQTVAFDQKYAYIFNGTNFVEFPSTVVTRWHGPDYSEFFTTNYWFLNGSTELFWATNFNSGASGDPIRYYDGTDWKDLTPDIDSLGNKLITCRILLPYKNRLVALNTWEGANKTTAVNRPNLARWSTIGNPTLSATSWLSTPGQGGFLEAPTNEIITGAEFIKDVLVVKFESSSWKLVYTGNNQLPFVWQKINREMGSESTFSLVPFDNGVLSVGNLGITTDDSVSVQRIDIQIPNQVYEINGFNNGVKRVSGVRDYINQLVYWAYPSSETGDQSTLLFPNRVLVYNYINNTYAIFNDSFTCFGYYTEQSAATWANTNISWQNNNTTWNSSNQGAFQPSVAAGNQDGFVFILGTDRNDNDESLQILAFDSATNQILIPHHNLNVGDFVTLNGIIGTGPDALNGITDKIKFIGTATYTIDGVSYTVTTITLDKYTSAVPAGTYIGGGTVTIINNFNVSTKVFVPTYQSGSQCRLGYVDFLLSTTAAGQCVCNVYVDENDSISINDPSADPSMLGTNVLLTCPENPTLPIVQFQINQKKIWHRMFFNVVCQNFMLNFSMSDEQMLDPDINTNNFVLHAMTLYTSANARLTQ